MFYIENINELKQSMKMGEDKKGRHTINKAAPFLPFKTRNPERPKFKRKFIGVCGELSRLINSKKLIDGFQLENCIDEIIEKVEFKNEDDKKYLNEIIKDYLIDDCGDIKVFHANILNYLQLTENDEAVGEKDIANFMYSIFFDDFKIFDEIFNCKEDKNIIVKLILEKLNGLEETEVKPKYYDKLNFVSEIGKEDFKFIIKNKEFFLKNFSTLLAYYYFYYITQLTIKLNKKVKEGVSYEEVEEVYYLLDWEKASSNRKSNFKGYKFIKSEGAFLLININLIEHLNFLFGVKGKDFIEIKKIYVESSDEEKENYLETLNEWIKIYANNFEIQEENIDDDNMEFENLILKLEKLLKKQYAKKENQGPMSRYSLSIEEIGKKYFLKYRGGKYGYMLNLTQEMILLLTAISVKENSITLKELFNEFEKRGVFLDRYSKELVTDLLIKLNLVDKKSDSGDAQYVKAIL